MRRDDDEDKTGHAPLFAVVAALLDVAKVEAAYASPKSREYRALAAACAVFLGDDEEAEKHNALPTASPYAYGQAPVYMPPGPEPTPGIPASARDDAKRNRR